MEAEFQDYERNGKWNKIFNVRIDCFVIIEFNCFILIENRTFIQSLKNIHLKNQ